MAGLAWPGPKPKLPTPPTPGAYRAIEQRGLIDERRLFGVVRDHQPIKARARLFVLDGPDGAKDGLPCFRCALQRRQRLFVSCELCTLVREKQGHVWSAHLWRRQKGHVCSAWLDVKDERRLW